jgi:hypothetical protein
VEVGLTDDREWNAFETEAYIGDRACVAPGQAERRRHRPRAHHKQLNRRAPPQRDRAGGCVSRSRQWLDRPELLADGTEWLAARGQDADTCAARDERFGQLSAGFEQVLAIVKDNQASS